MGRRRRRRFQDGRGVDGAYPGTPSPRDSDEEYVALSGKVQLTTLNGDSVEFPFDEITSIGSIASLVLRKDIFDRGDRPREGQPLFQGRVFKTCDFAEKVWQVVHGLEDRSWDFIRVFRCER